MNISRRERFWIALSAALFIVILIGRGQISPVDARERSTDNDVYSQLATFTDVLAIVQRDYVRDVDGKALVEGAIKGMITSLDPHSGYLDPDFYQDLQVQTKGEFGGLGLEITVKDGLLVVVSPMEGSPADRAGIKAGDAIVKIDGKFTKDFTLVDAVKRLRGPKGSPITLAVHRDGRNDIFDVVVIRDNIQVKSVRSRDLGEGFGYVRVNQFMETSADDLTSALKRVAEQSPSGEIKGLVLDFRNNPGGLLTQAIRISDMFLKEGIIVYTDGRVEGQKQKFYAHVRGTEPDYPIVVLVNGGSASASEIVAGALKEHGRAIIVGTTTFGKGSVQTITPLDNGGALSLTTALYYLKNGDSIQLTGVKPDVAVENPPPPVDDEVEKPTKLNQYLREGDLPGAINNPNGDSDETGALQRINKTPKVPTGKSKEYLDPDKEPLDSLLKRDLQLAKAIEVVKGYNVLTTARNN